ncbi:DUF3953 domain-containing protein [Priestia endophytica]|uniref:DUF3953 domain-containing protein n=1 Tax=Priestia endophytica TaxID=135735 RepID=UPI000DCA7828|nr:DUF3953 domain-containing protein [Priestia endophytica]RAS74481.1 hypothetical protein A4R27_24080 [Priestia endophytica]
MLKRLRIFLSVIVLILSVYSLITQNFELMPYSMFLLGTMILVTGLLELKRDKKEFWGYVYIIVSLFAVYVSVQGFLLN